jgi:hypothetical protein
MGVLFESILLFSLAVLIILVGLLVYYFKKRIVEVEQNNASCLEVVQDVYLQHVKLRNEFYSLVVTQQHQQQSHPHFEQKHEVQTENRIKIELSEDESSDDEEEDNDSDVDDSDSESDDSDDSDSEKETKSEIKIVNVDLKFPQEFEIDIDEEINEEEVNEEEEELKSLDNIDPIIVNKVGPSDISKDELKKLTPSALKLLLISKGLSAEEVSKMKKNELIQKLL